MGNLCSSPARDEELDDFELLKDFQIKPKDGNGVSDGMEEGNDGKVRRIVDLMEAVGDGCTGSMEEGNDGKAKRRAKILEKYPSLQILAPSPAPIFPPYLSPANELVMAAMAVLNTRVAESKTLPEVGFKKQVLGGEYDVSLQNGFLFGTNTFRSLNNASITSRIGARTLAATLVLGPLSGHYDASIRITVEGTAVPISSIIVHGGANITIESVNVNLVAIEPVVPKAHFDVQEFKVTNMTGFSIRVYGMSAESSLSKEIVDFVTKELTLWIYEEISVTVKSLAQVVFRELPPMVVAADDGDTKSNAV